MDSRSFSFEAGGRPTQPRWPNHWCPSFPIVTETGRSPITVSMVRIHAGRVASGVVFGCARARVVRPGIAMHAVRKEQTIRRARDTGRWYRRIDFAQPLEEEAEVRTIDRT